MASGNTFASELREISRGVKKDNALPVLTHAQVDDVYEDVKMAAMVAALHGFGCVELSFGKRRGWQEVSAAARREVDDLRVEYFFDASEAAQEAKEAVMEKASADGFQFAGCRLVWDGRSHSESRSIAAKGNMLW